MEERGGFLLLRFESGAAGAAGPWRPSRSQRGRNMASRFGGESFSAPLVFPRGPEHRFEDGSGRAGRAPHARERPPLSADAGPALLNRRSSRTSERGGSSAPQFL